MLERILDYIIATDGSETGVWIERTGRPHIESFRALWNGEGATAAARPAA